MKGEGAKRKRIEKKRIGKDNMVLPRDKNLRPRSTELRNNATRHENHLWYDFLRTYRIRFNRQRIIGDYIADFYCPKANLVIELDGSQHFEKDAIEYDKIRTAYFTSLGIKEIRFNNNEIDNNFYEVCSIIDKTVQSSGHFVTTSFPKEAESPLERGRSEAEED